MDPDVAALVRESRLLEAAKLASDRGQAHDASILYERACEWRSAAAEALRAGEASRALELAVEAGDGAIAERACAIVAIDPVVSDAAADRLARRGRHAWAARVLEACGRTRDAAAQWEQAGEAIRAAGMLERAGDAAAAARALEAGVRRDPQRWAVAVALGALLARFGKTEAAVRTLQRVPADARERRDALAHLASALASMGLAHAARDAAAELASLGGSPAPVESQADAPAARLFGRYDVVREVASSPSARVVECVDAVRGDRVAVKIFAAWSASGAGRDALARFEREVRAMRALDHPHVVPLRDFVADGPAIVLEWMPGGTLEARLAAGPLAPARAVEITCAILSALGEAHRLGILHRDVKPANVLFDAAGAARLSDFGVAHLGDASATATAALLGTLAYMSPEQRAASPATARSDVYSVGVILREMLSHRALDSRHDAAVAAISAPDPALRPDAFEAHALLLALPWPADVDDAPPPERRSPSVHPPPQRLEPRADGSLVDAWTGRAIERVDSSDVAIARARAFAGAGDTALQTVLRIDRRDSAIWLESPRGAPLDRPLDAAERSTLERALSALHAAGVAHGRVDRAHVVVGEAGVVLRFSSESDATATPDRDRIALSRL